MKKNLVLLMTFIVIFAFEGCGKQEIRINIKNADNITIFYGASSYAMSGADGNTIKTLSDCFNSLSFKKTNKEMDISTILMIHFLEGEKSIAKVSVDENGVFWLNGGTECYKIASGSFNYDDVKDIYEKSK